jgi:hypothetical protein
MKLLRHVFTAGVSLLFFSFFLNLIPIMAQNVTHNVTDYTGFAKNNSMRDLKNPALTIEKNPLANLSNPLENLKNPIQNLTK